MQYNFMLAGTQSGCGKTSVCFALLQQLMGSGCDVRAFKAGPDFLDPMWHQVATQKTSYNLDTRMMGEAMVQHTFAFHAAKWNIIEGVMGLFDGAKGVGQEGSSLDLARVLSIPVLLVVDAKGMSGSIVALVAGFCAYAAQSGVMIHGIIANRVGSMRHVELLSEMLNQHDLPPLVGWMKKNAPTLPERHLGLQRPEEVSIPDFSDHFYIDQAQLISQGRAMRLMPERAPDQHVQKTIAIARDAAFCFIYQANLDWLQQQGWQLSFFSPLAGEAVPASDMLWLPGGYPELYAQTLSESATWESVCEVIEADQVVLAECGGMMVLGQSLRDQAGQVWPMAGLLPFDVEMQDRLVSLGYRQQAKGVKGHEFHHSKRLMEVGIPQAFALEGRGDTGLRYRCLRASYVHWYFPSTDNLDWLL
ncbi:MAG: cobyrinate a,c-diamide synthase [Mariprofundaceae bacterium]|nr:cobyrinate a,c-diamide synthase [Mariprofundaceae bacterium]